jgi:uncharacterized membrane protein YfcA
VTHAITALGLGLAAGVLSGLFGVGGGTLFVPTLTLVLGLEQLHAEATSLAAMIPVVALGAWRQHRYGNVDLRAAGMVGAVSIGGVVAGTAVATALPQDVLRRLFAGLLVLVALQLLREARVRRGPPTTP